MQHHQPQQDPPCLSMVKNMPLPAARITLLCAPTGFGKSALAAEWFSHWQQARCWFQLAPNDNFLPQFVGHLSKQLQLPVLQVSQASDTSLSAAFIEQLRQHQTDSTTLLILDDLQVLEEPLSQGSPQTESSGVVLQLLKQILQLQQFKLVLCSRYHHNALLTPFKLKGQVAQIDSAQLRLSQQEIQGLLAHSPAAASPAWITAMDHYLQGWPALWQMVSRLLQQGMAIEQINIDALTADIADYLVAESIETLPSTLKELLYTLVVFERFDLKTAAHAYGQSHLSAKLQALLQRQLFLQRSSDCPPLFSFSPFFREALYHHLALNDSQRLEIAVYRGFNALMQEQQWQAAAQLVVKQQSRLLAKQWLSRAGWPSFNQAHYQRLEQLFALVPRAEIQANAQLAPLYAWLLLEGKKDSVATKNFIKPVDSSLWSRAEQARLDACWAELCYQFDLLNDALQCAKRAIANADNTQDKLAPAFTQAMAHLWLGQLNAAEQQLQALAPVAYTKEQHHIAVAITLRQANISQLQGHFPQALQQTLKAQERSKTLNLVNDHLNDAVYRTLSELYLSLAQFDKAEVTLKQGCALEKPLGDYWWISYKSLQLRLALFQGSAITQLVADLEQRLEKQVICRQWRYRALCSLQLSYRWQDQAQKLQQVQKRLSWHPKPKNLFDMQDNLLYARNQVLLTKALPTALAEQSQQWRQQGLSHLAAQADFLQHYQHWLSSGKVSAALIKDSGTWLQMGYLWEFLLLGPQAVSLWQALLTKCRAHAQQIDSLNKLIALCTQSQHKAESQQTPSQLTKKEWLVLQAIGQGYSNEQIAAQMHIALSTVKSHVNHLYRKLAINNRIEAKAQALSLALQEKI